MTSAESATFTRFDIGRVVGRTFSALGGAFFLFYPAFVVLNAASTLLLLRQPAFRQMLGGLGAPSNPLAIFGPNYFLALAIGLVGGLLLQLALTHRAIVYMNGRRAGLGECFAAALRSFFPVLLIMILYAVGVGLGFLLLFVPGVILMIYWIAVIPVAMAERTLPTRAFARSAELTEGHRWVIFFVALCGAVFGWVVAAVQQLVAAALAAGGLFDGYWATLVPQAVAAPLNTMIGAVGGASIYFELQRLKEGPQTDNVAAVFD